MLKKKKGKRENKERKKNIIVMSIDQKINTHQVKFIIKNMVRTHIMAHSNVDPVKAINLKKRLEMKAERRRGNIIQVIQIVESANPNSKSPTANHPLVTVMIRIVMTQKHNTKENLNQLVKDPQK